MNAFDFLEDLFKQWRDVNEYSKSAMNIVTAIGLIYLAHLALKALYNSIIGIRLYVTSQILWKEDFRKSYGDWALVTGATDGIGLAMAKELARRGHSVIIVGRNDEKLANSKAAIQAENANIEIKTVKIDMSDPSDQNYKQVKTLIDQSDIGILINNAGFCSSKLGRFHKASVPEMRDLVNVNILGTVHFTNMVLPGMIERGRGLVINVSSTLGSMPGPFANIYSCSKAFVNNLSENLQLEYKSHPIDIINLTPGAVQTKLFHDVYDNKFLHRPTFVAPGADDFAKSALNACSTRISSFCGAIGHAIVKEMLDLSKSISLSLYYAGVLLSFRLHNSQFTLSPVPKRKANANRKETSSSAENSNELDKLKSTPSAILAGEAGQASSGDNGAFDS